MTLQYLSYSTHLKLLLLELHYFYTNMFVIRVATDCMIFYFFLLIKKGLEGRAGVPLQRRHRISELLYFLNRCVDIRAVYVSSLCLIQ